jgi:hypothetical protein
MTGNAALHQLCAPMLDHAESLPEPQREALRTAFGLSVGPAPDQFLVGLAVLGLLSETARERPLVCVVDDQQWLDHASAQALGSAARRLAADPVGLVFAARVPGPDVAGLPELVVEGLAASYARALLESVLTGLAGPLDARVGPVRAGGSRGTKRSGRTCSRGGCPAVAASRVRRDRVVVPGDQEPGRPPPAPSRRHSALWSRPAALFSRAGDVEAEHRGAYGPLQPAFSDAERLALAGFLAGYRGLTREAYALDLRQLTTWCRTCSLNLFAVRRADIEGIARDLEARGRGRAAERDGHAPVICHGG